MNQYEEALSATATANNSAGSGYRENAEYLKSYSAQINLMRNAWTEAVIAMRDSGLGDAMIVGLSAGLEFFKAITSIIDNIGILPSIIGLGSVALLLLSERFRDIVTSINTSSVATSKWAVESVKNFNAVSASASKTAFDISKITSTTVTANASSTIGSIATSAQMATVATKGFSGALATLGTALRTFALPVAGFMLLGSVISKVTSAIIEHRKEQQELRKSYEETIDKGMQAVSTNREQLDSLVKSYKTLSSQKETGQWNIKNEEEYLNIQQELATIFPSLVDYIDEKGEAHIKAAEGIDTEIASMEHLLNLKRQEMIENAKDTYKERLKPLENYLGQVEDLERQIVSKRKGIENFTGAGMSPEEAENVRKISADQIRKLEEDKRYAEAMLSQSAQNLSQDIQNTFNSFVGMLANKVSPQIQSEMANIFRSMSWSDKNAQEIENAQKAISNFAIQLDEAFDAGDSDGYKRITGQLLTYLQNEFGITEQEARKFVSSYKNMQNAVENDKTLGKLTRDAENAEEALGGMAEQGEEVKDIIEKLSGVSKNHVQDSEDLIWMYESLSLELSLLSKGTEEYDKVAGQLNETTSALLSMYPHLSQESLNLIDKFEKLNQSYSTSASAQRELEEVMDRLLALHPELDKANISRNNLIKIITKSIEDEKEANDILRQATEASKEGKLTAEEEMARASLKHTTSRIRDIMDEVSALNILRKALEDAARSSDRQTSDSAGKALMRLSMTEGTPYHEDTYNSSMKDYNEELDKLLASRDKDISTLKNSEALKEKDKKATEKKTKAEKDATKAMEHSIFVANQYKLAMEALSLEIKRQQDIQSQFPDYSAKHVEALQKEIKLQQEKDKLLESQEKNLQAQIKAGEILKTGVVTTGSEKVQNLSGWGGTINSQYGMRTHPIYGDVRMHEGIDIGGKRGARLDANVSGKVVAAGNHKTLGNYVTIQAEDGLKHIYGHLDKVVAKLGDTITAGMQIGNIGNTGASKGSHLHYQVNDESGKSINPASYVDSARKGISNASKEAAQAKADIEAAKSELVGVQSQRIDEQAKLRELEARLISTTLSPFENRRKQSQQIIDYEIAKLGEVDKSSERYGKTLDKVSSHLKAKQRANQEELVALDKLIQSGDLTGDILVAMKDRVWELKNATFDLNAELNAIDLERLNLVMGKHDEIINDINFEYQRSIALMGLYEEGTADYNEQLANSIEFQKQERDAVKDAIEAAQQEILTLNLGTEAMKDKQDEIQGMIVQYWNLSGAVLNSEKALEASRKKLAENAADAMINAYKSYLSEKRDMTMRSYDDEMKAEDNRHKKVMDNYKAELDAFRKLIQERIDAIDKVENERSYSKEIDKLEEERLKVMNRLNLLSLDDSLEAKAERKKLSEDLSKIDEDLFEKRNAKEVTDRKDNLNEMLKAKEEQIQKEEQAADEQHEAAKDRIDKERRYWDQFYTDQLNDERKFAKMKEDIVAGNFDKMSQEFQDYIKEMEDTMPDLLDTLDGTMQAVGSSIRQNLIDNLREALDMLAQVDANNIATKNPAPGGQGSHGTGAGGTHGSSPSQSVSTLNSADLQVLTGKFYNDKLVAEEKNPVRKGKIKDKAYELAAAGRASGSTYSSSEGFDSIITGLSKADLEILGQHLLGSGSQHVSSPDLQDFIKKAGQRLMASSMKLSTGGYVDKGSQGLAMLHEQEVVLNKKETSDFFKYAPILEKLHNLLAPLTMPKVNAPDLAGAGGDTNYTFEFYVDKMTGSKQDADNFMQQINDRLKRNKGMR